MVDINWRGERLMVREGNEGKVTSDKLKGENVVSQQWGQAQKRLKMVKDRMYVRM